MTLPQTADSDTTAGSTLAPSIPVAGYRSSAQPNPAPADTTQMPPIGEALPSLPDNSLPALGVTDFEESPTQKSIRETPHGFWASGEYLFWWIKNGQLPPLVTAGGNGVPGSPGTRVLVDDLDFDNDFRHGGRFALGYHFKQVPDCGLEVSGFFLSERESVVGFASAGVPVLARPFANTSTGSADAALVASPGTAAGAINVAAQTSMWGAEGNLAASVICNDKFHLATFGGFRYLFLEDEVRIADQFTATENVPVFGGRTVSFLDDFRTVNRFYGGQVGAEVGLQIAKFSLDVRGKIALGTMHQVAYVNGTTMLLGSAGPTQVIPGGLLGLRSNNGRYDRDEIAYIPEVAINLGCQVTPHLKLFTGYSLLWINTVARAGEQIDTVVNPSQLATPAGPGTLTPPARPAFHFNDTTFWAQGLNFGLELRY